MQVTNYCVYKHTTPSNKVYIGITCKDAKSRWRNGEGYATQDYFYKAIKKYGWKNINHEILFVGLSQEEAEKKEIELIELYRSNDRRYGYNIAKGGKTCSGFHHTEDTKAILSQKMSGENHPQFGTHRAEETKQKIRNAHLGKKRGAMTEEQKEKIKKTRKRKPVMCVETNIVYSSAYDVQDKLKLSAGHISECCNHKRATEGGLHWKFAEEVA